MFILYRTDKTIKLWKVFEKSLKVVSESVLNDGPQPLSSALRIPKLAHQDTIIAAAPRKVYANGKFLGQDNEHAYLLSYLFLYAILSCLAHAYHINSISTNSDSETYISADDLRINLWNLNISDQSFSKYQARGPRYGDTNGAVVSLIDIVDIKPANMEELTEVITAAEFHPYHCNMFMYSSSKGTIKLSDMRESALCDQHAKSKLK
jgi:serine/threonine-protein phosphatase 2A regulatory subunit B